MLCVVELQIPERGNVFYAVDTSVEEIQFVVKNRTDLDRVRQKHMKGKGRRKKRKLDLRPFYGLIGACLRYRWKVHARSENKTRTCLVTPAMERFVGMFSHAGETKIRSDDDVVDRLNHRYSTFILVVFAVVVSTKQYVGEPINCWCPAQFTDNHEDFTNKICWVSNTYYVPPSQRHLPGALEPRERIGYYQWVPMILLTQAVFFYMPCMLWRFLNNKSGIDVNSVLQEAVKLNDTAWCERRGKTLRFTAQQMSRYLSGTREFRRGRCTRCKHFVSRHFCLVCGRRYGNYLVTLYIFIKLLYLANIAAQLFALEAFLGSDYHIYGVQLVVRLLRQQDWAASERFPRVTLCDFYVRQLGNIHRHTVQCVLPINLFNEKIFIFVWFWLVFMASVVVCSTLAWLYRNLVRLRQVSYVKHHLQALQVLKKDDERIVRQRVRQFVVDYLRQDGIFLVRLVGLNASELVAAELLSELWGNFNAGRNSLLRRKKTANGVEQV
ncbi:Innexin unc-7 [Lamellibrachia satsuma]|nr:Innexin unc-7 [Lamellibrachia satsuma]